MTKKESRSRFKSVGIDVTLHTEFIFDGKIVVSSTNSSLDLSNSNQGMCHASHAVTLISHCRASECIYAKFSPFDACCVNQFVAVRIKEKFRKMQKTAKTWGDDYMITPNRHVTT